MILRTAMATIIFVTTITNTSAAKELDTDWLSYGKDFSEQRFSTLQEINKLTVDKLGVAWYLDLPDTRTLEATPLMVAGVLYFSTNDSITYAVDARTGMQIWKFDPEVWKAAGKRYRQVFHVNRGVAYSDGAVYVGTFDGRLIAINAKSGEEIWSTQTLEEGSTGYITGAPRVFNGKVVIGQGGTEAGYARGYVTAYDADTGKQVWRFYVVPGNPAKGFENPAMAMAAKTWTGEWWTHGGGGNPWDSLVYDPEFNRLYIGTGNGTPWNHKIRSPDGGDNLFLSSIVAVDADTGEYIWHYQTNPGETWDYTSTQSIVLADINIDGQSRKVLMHAPKNGFFYVIDRVDGKLISAEKLGQVSWAKKIDIESGRPIENPEARFPHGTGINYPSGAGLHNWQSMSYSRKSGLTYIPKLEMPQFYSDKSVDSETWKARKYFFNTGYDVIEVEGMGEISIQGSLLAWNPATQTKAWEVELPGIWNGGTLATAGDLVFQGNASGEFAAYDALNGDKLWSANVGLGIVAAPITYSLDDKQYVAVLVGWAGSLPGMFGLGVNQYGWQYGEQIKRLVVFSLNESAYLPIEPKSPLPIPVDNPALIIDEEVAHRGGQLFNSSCHSCHGFSAVAGGLAPDLRASRQALDLQVFRSILKEGVLESRGMPKYQDLTETEIGQLYLYVRYSARKSLNMQSKKGRE